MHRHTQNTAPHSSQHMHEARHNTIQRIRRDIVHTTHIAKGKGKRAQYTLRSTQHTRDHTHSTHNGHCRSLMDLNKLQRPTSAWPPPASWTPHTEHKHSTQHRDHSSQQPIHSGSQKQHTAHRTQHTAASTSTSTSTSSSTRTSTSKTSTTSTQRQRPTPSAP
jgi:hypothetical protein